MHAGFRSDHRHCSGSGCASRSSAHESNELDVCLHRRLRNFGVRMSTIRGISLEIVSGDFSCRLMDRIVGILDKVDTVGPIDGQSVSVVCEIIRHDNRIENSL